MTIWAPESLDPRQPAYLAIADAIAGAVRLGQLRPGDQLPTHRMLADLLGVNVSTVTRAYREAAHRRLVDGEVGRGTFVLGVASEAALFALQRRPAGGVIDLSTNMPPIATRDEDLKAALEDISPGEAARLLHYPGPGDGTLHRQLAATWLKRRGVDPDPEAIVVCAGAQHAMDTALGLFPEFEEVACEALVYPGLKAAARHWERRLHAMPMDEEGVLPEAFEAACRNGVRMAVFSPTLHNPTTGIMGLERRQAIVRIARKWDVLLVEEDVYGLLPDKAPEPLAALAPERTIFLTGLSKTVAPGLRIGYLVLPERLRDRGQEAEHHTSWYVSPLTAALATRWLKDGTAWKRLLAQRRELAARAGLCSKLLQGLAWRGQPCCPHVWLTLPPGTSQALAKRALDQGLVVVAAKTFAVGRQPTEDGIRLSIGSAPNRKILAEGLSRLASLMR